MLYLLVGAISDGKPFDAIPRIALGVNGPDGGNIPLCRHDFPDGDQSPVLAGKEKPRHAGAFP
ncbi:hypothetical protein EN836_20490 [Mesorhizobium sp. M1C.F.Ca.ET.193.01.1.1]|uniref:hypothetical protein n=1 Tax=unclassified Mesorhizobium TaxID=325217 RepID=UPI001091EEE7|nr:MULTISPECIES: hypothetical protein [unclassified Mesorhizobium]TGR77276.1 hypothetical protein EN832_20490 [Mesorhizobium sp. M1C.F.Ca.ET.189.01.1.1]TGR80253.1 hypothetical protein EN836_20490 [Mesorhizobium sp. M1C.F.Ca.ET.193.01.1.1]TGS25032.1 hypothetical protein EN830_20490 [Mesorhizobium sp. M1C.F.Ca.ET.187.01.1.1]TGS72539.1 hypothetical protein EN819_20490 [Mesorhizobium sp. M1C.F.Ca.ET.176.01.1.1]